MALDKTEDEVLALLMGPREWEMLQVLARNAGRIPKEEIKALIRGRYWGHLKDLGDDVYQARSAQVEPERPATVESLQIERIEPGSLGPHK